jgi:hypothetical protein
VLRSSSFRVELGPSCPDHLLEVEPRPPSTQLMNKYVDRVQAAAETDTIVAKRFMRVAGFHDSPASLMLPPVMLRVAATNWRQARARRLGEETVAAGRQAHQESTGNCTAAIQPSKGITVGAAHDTPLATRKFSIAASGRVRPRPASSARDACDDAVLARSSSSRLRVRHNQGR